MVEDPEDAQPIAESHSPIVKTTDIKMVGITSMLKPNIDNEMARKVNEPELTVKFMKTPMHEPRKQAKRLKKMTIKKRRSKRKLKKKAFKSKKTIELTVKGEIQAEIEQSQVKPQQVDDKKSSDDSIQLTKVVVRENDPGNLPYHSHILQPINLEDVVEAN